MMDLRYGTGRWGRRATVIDHARDGEIFCFVDGRGPRGELEIADARAKDIAALFNEAGALDAENARLTALLNSPETEDFAKGVVLEAAHQRGRWGAEHDAGKTPFDWFWLVGYLAQKAASAALAGDVDKARHHTISTAAALANWHLALAGGDTSMRPGIEPPDDLGDCDLCNRPLALGQFVNDYEDVGTVHADCDSPFGRPAKDTPSPDDDGTTMPTYVLLGAPARLFPAPTDRVTA